MSYIVDCNDGFSYFQKLEEYEEVLIYPMHLKGLLVVEIRDCRKPFKQCTHVFKKVEKFTIVSEECDK